MYTENWSREFEKNTAFIDRNSIVTAMEIGNFQGMTTNFICDELLAHNGKIIAIDPLEDNYGDSDDADLFKGQYEKFVENTERNKDRIFQIRKKSQDVLPLLKDESVDFCYIDGEHSYPALYFDLVESFRIVKTGGLILVDDYNWGGDKPLKRAVDTFLEENQNYRLLHKVNQVLFQKLEEGSEMEDGQDRYNELSVEKLFNEKTIYAGYCNLAIRSDRNEKMIKELDRVGLKMERVESFWWEDLWNNANEEDKIKYGYMHDIRKTPGAIGCWVSQMEIMQRALSLGKHAWVNEDDLIFCDDIHDRLKECFKFLHTHEWDVLWLGSTFHKEPTWHKVVEGKHTHPDLQMCTCNLNRDWEETTHPDIVRTYGAFSTHSYIINKDRIQHHLDFLNNCMHMAMGIDFAYILEQPKLHCYAFQVGMCKQYDDKSNIGNGWSRHSGFEKSLGSYWFQPNLNNYKK